MSHICCTGLDSIHLFIHRLSEPLLLTVRVAGSCPGRLRVEKHSVTASITGQTLLCFIYFC